MSRARVLIAFALTGLALAAIAHADDWNKSYDVSGTPELRLITSDANVRVSAGSGNKVEAHLTTSDYKIGSGGISVYEHQSAKQKQAFSKDRPVAAGNLKAAKKLLGRG